MIKVCSLYPQYQSIPDRRLQSSSVSFERRSGSERRSPERINLDTNLTKDIFVVRNSVSALNKKDSVSFEGLNNIPFVKKLVGAVESLKSQEIGKNLSDINLRKENKIQPPKSDAYQTAGILGGALASALSVLFLGASSLVVGLGSAIYLGCKAVKNAVVTHLKR